MTEPATTTPTTTPTAEATGAAASHEGGHGDGGHGEGGHAHPSELEYIKVAIFLALITLAEVAVYYVESLKDDWLVPILLVMSPVKFAMVVLWFMHLRFDSRLFRRLFFTGLGLALFCYMAVLSTFHVWTE